MASLTSPASLAEQIAELHRAPWLPRVVVTRDRLRAALNVDRFVLFLPADVITEATRLFGMRVIHAAEVTEPMVGLEPGAL